MNSSRPPPPPAQGAPPSYAFVTRVYRRNLRPVVIFFAFLAGIWALFSGIGFFRNVSVYNTGGSSKLATFSIVLGALYMAIVAIEAYGMFAAISQKLPLVRIYAYLSLLVFILVVAIGLIKTVIHFAFKNDIISVCTGLATGSRVVTYAGFWGPVSQGVLSRAEAQDWCNRSWDRGSWSEILSLLIISIMAATFASVAFSYFRQVLDPTSPANLSREPLQQRTDAYPSHYNPPYNPFGPPQANQPFYPYPPPAGPPPGQNTDAFIPPYENKPPGYVRGDDYKGGYGDMDKNDREDGPSERDVTNRENPFR